MNLTSEDRQHYYGLEKGYEGELKFDSLTEKLRCECLILNNLLLKVKKTSFQIDSLIIFQEKIYLYEVKNFEGDYYYESNKLYKKPRFEIVNPLVQLSKSDTLLSQLLLGQGYNIPIESFVIFINPNFFLYQAPLNKPIIFPHQVKGHLNNVNRTPSKLTNKQRNLAQRLVALHNNNSPYTQIPAYNYNQLRKGITCLKCESFSVFVEKSKCVCADCGQAEAVPDAVLRSVKEFQILFPKEKITTNIIYDWCRVVHPKQRIWRILRSKFKIVGVHQWAYFE